MHNLDEKINMNNVKGTRIIHVKNTYISPYILHNINNNEGPLKNIDKILKEEKDNINIKINNVNNKETNNDNHTLKYSTLCNDLNIMHPQNKDEEIELNTISTVIHMNSDEDSDKDNDTIINENNDLLSDNIKKYHAVKDNHNNIIYNDKYNTINNNSVINDVSNSIHFNNNSYITNFNLNHNFSVCNRTLNNTCTSQVNLRNNMNSNKKTNNNNKNLNNEINKKINNDNIMNEFDDINNKKNNYIDCSVYKCEDEIPLGTILNIQDLDIHNRNNMNNCNNNINNKSKILTTVMLRNIPNKYTQNMLMDVMNEHFKGLYDFFYLPIDFRNKCNVGYAFINFIHPYYAELFIKFFNNYKLNAFKSNKVCSVTWGRVQGLKANIEHYRNSAIMTIPIPQYKPILFQNGIIVSWPESDGPLPSIKLRSQKF
ncbi:RNA-binding protein mei2 homologue, putative [Plasmodium reichenowi]|uniref:RNA-binding protein mei2 homologue, putative n=1 Tax=Plasmodium reichenowi TaxID=5854 RepID=A0A060RPT8_PLARE|nr:RNA-binding protein mei2 homologue, putative [Plasmodium reichenowi]